MKRMSVAEQKTWKTFSQEDWDSIESGYTAFWENKLERPIVIFPNVCNMNIPEVPEYRNFLSAYPFSMNVEEIVDILSRRLNRNIYIGDTFPCTPANLQIHAGGDLIVLCGYDAEEYIEFPEQQTVYSRYKKLDIETIRFQPQKNSFWYRRAMDLLHCMLDIWGESVTVKSYVLGGPFCNIEALIGTEQLIFNMIDRPDMVSKLAQEALRIKFEICNEINTAIQRVCKGTSCWANLWSKRLTDIEDCDFAINMSPGMLKSFVAPLIQQFCDVTPDSFYHCDTAGRTEDIDMLLSIKNLKGIQWIPGIQSLEAGNPQWYQLYKKIRQAGKLVQIYVNTKDVLFMKNEIDLAGFFLIIEDVTQPEDAQELYKKLVAQRTL